MAKAPSIVTDIWGDEWRVTAAKATGLEWDILMGRAVGYTGRGNPAIIMTEALRDYLDAMRHEPAMIAEQLPIGRTAIKGLRRALGHHWRDDRSDWWLERLADLSDLTGEQFAAIHGASAGAISMWRTHLLGPRQRPAGWWREDDAREVIMTRPTADAAADLGISVSSVRRLRWMLAAKG